MRSRFLNLDYLSTKRGIAMDFMRLEIPRLPPAGSDEVISFISHTDEVSCPAIHPFPIDSALSTFFSQVLPHPLEHLFCLDGESDGDGEQRFAFVQFEEPELDICSDDICLCDVEGKRMLAEAQEIENKQDMFGPGVLMQSFDQIQESVYLVQDLSLQHDMDGDVCIEGDGSVQQTTVNNENEFPLFEVDDVTLRNFTSISAEDQCLSILKSMEPQWGRLDNPILDAKEMLGLVEYDYLEFLSNHCWLRPHLDSDLAPVDGMLGGDVLGLMDALRNREDSAGCNSPMNPFILEEFEFIELEASQIHQEFFGDQKADEPETCDSMFTNEMNFKSLDELVVVSELALEDDIFKSLPIPNILDHQKINPISTFIAEFMNALEPIPPSASDGIYLDWQLLEVDDCNNGMFSTYEGMLKNVVPQKIDLHRKCFNDRRSISDFILSEDVSNELPMEEQKESLDIFTEVAVESLFKEIASTQLSDDVHSENRKQIAESKAGMASQFFKSMSEFNDLDFFLNAGKSVADAKTKSVVRPLGSNVTNDQNLLHTELKGNIKFSEDIATEKPSPMFMLVPCEPLEMETKQNLGGMAMESSPGIIIIINTQNFDKEMIVSRRSTYQRILSKEKEGAQILERDMDLPVDIIISSAICLVWYESKNIGKKATAPDEASSSLPLCVEHIATNVLTSLSFAFSGCILVFEGEMGFISTIMENSDGIYAAACGLGMDVQLFFSLSPESTEDIILCSIFYTAKLNRTMYPKLPESESLAESFLTKFPSINPLTAHAILSSGGTLLDFLKWTNERRTVAVQQYLVPNESVALFSALSKYGEREDSKSIMTECSSSVSSGPDSDKCNINFECSRKRRKYSPSPPKLDINLDDIWQTETLNQLADGISGHFDAFKPHSRQVSTNPDIIDELKWPTSSFSDPFRQNKQPGSPFTDLAAINEHYSLKQYKSQQKPDDEKRKKTISLKQPGMTIKTMMKSDTSNSESFEHVHLGETVDLIDSPVLDPDFLSVTDPTDFGKSKAARRLSFGQTSHLSFPTAAEVPSDFGSWASTKPHRPGMQQENDHSDVNHNRDRAPLNSQKNLLEEILMQRHAGGSQGLQSKGGRLHHSGTPLSKALHSDNAQQGSPWTIEFLNRIKDKSRLRQQSLPQYIPCSPKFEYSGNIRKVHKRSPSILEFFRYQGGSKVPPEKKQKKSIPLSTSSKNKATSAPILPTWTPADKRATKTLSFATKGSGKQTRLVWSDESAYV